MTSKYTRQLISNKIYTEEYDCVQFSLELQHLSQKEGCKLGLAIIGYEDCGHMVNYYKNNGIWFIEPQSMDNKINLEGIEFIEFDEEINGFNIFEYDKGWHQAIVNDKYKFYFD